MIRPTRLQIKVLESKSPVTIVADQRCSGLTTALVFKALNEEVHNVRFYTINLINTLDIFRKILDEYS